MSSGELLVEAVDAARVRPLRQRILRPDQPPEACVYPGDDDPESGHFAVLDGELVLATASVYHQAESTDDPGAWRLRGMTVLPEARGRGLGRLLTAVCEAHARERGGTQLWCNARLTAAQFYRAIEFSSRGPEFDLPGIGAHVVMERAIPRE